MPYAQNEIPLAAFGASRWGDQPAKTIAAFRRILEHEMDGYGGTIIGEAGKYLLPEPVEIDKPVAIVGQGFGGSTYIEQAPGVAYAPLTFVAGARRAGLHGIHVHGNGIGPAVVVDGAAETVLHMSEIIGGYDGLVVLGQGHRVYLTGATQIADNRHHGIFAQGGSHGIYIDPTCVIRSNGFDPNPGDDLGDNINWSSSNENIMLGNSYDAAGFIIRMYASGQNIVSVANLNSCGRSAISLEAGSSANMIAVGLIHAPGMRNALGEDWPAVRLVDASFNEISGFLVEYHAQHAPRGRGPAIRLIGDCRDNTIGVIRERLLAA